MAMVQLGYAALLTARYTEFLDGAVVEGLVIQPLRLIDADNTVRLALYTLEKQPTGVADWYASARSTAGRPRTPVGAVMLQNLQQRGPGRAVHGFTVCEWPCFAIATSTSVAARAHASPSAIDLRSRRESRINLVRKSPAPICEADARAAMQQC